MFLFVKYFEESSVAMFQRKAFVLIMFAGIKSYCIKQLIGIIIILGVTEVCIAQTTTINLQRITSEQGLSDNQVTCALRDPLGYMWIGTKDGLNRYDGKSFYIFKHYESNSQSLCGNSIKCLELDGDTLLWIGTAGSGMCSFDFRTGKFTTYNKENSLLNSNTINDIAYDKQNKILWIALNHSGLQIFDLNRKTFKANPTLVSSNTYYDVELSDTVPFFAGIIESLKRIEKIGKLRTKTLPHDNARTINKIYSASNGNLWCGAWDNGLHEFDRSPQRLHSFYFDGSNKLRQSGDEIISIAEDACGILWCGTKTSGIHFFDLQSKKFVKNIQLSEKVSARVHHIYRDNFNRMWISTEAGLYVYNPLLNQFKKTLLPVPADVASCKVNDRLILNNGKEIVITTCGLFYKEANESTYLYKEIFYHNEKQELFSMHVDTGGQIFIGSNRTIFLLNPATLEVINLPQRNTELAKILNHMGGSRVNSITTFQGNKIKYIAASYYGINNVLFDIQNQVATNIYPDTTQKDVFLDNLCRKIIVDSKNNFWYCGANVGIVKVDFPKVKLDELQAQDNWLNGIVYLKSKNWSKIKSGNQIVNNVFDMVESDDGTFWVATQGNGLVKFFPSEENKPFVSYANNIKSLQGITKSDNENLWMVSSTGLLNYNIKTNRYKLFDAKSGVDEIISGYFFINKKNNTTLLSVGFDGGFFSFSPNNILRDTEKPSVYVSKLWIMDSECDSLLFSKLEMRHNRNFIKCYLSSNCFTNNEQVSYYYRLLGIDQEWRNNHNNPLITYTNLPPGDYLLEYKAMNSDGIASETKSLPIVIIPPFTQTWYFYLLLTAFVLGLIYLIYRIRVNQILKLQAVRNKIARDLHDDIGSTLGSINLFSQVANRMLREDKMEEVKPILEKIGISSREIIDKTGDVVWAVNPSNDNMQKLVMRMEVYAAQMLGTAGINFKFNCDEALYKNALNMTQRKNIFLIYKEAIHNIVKYAAASEVSILLSKHHSKVQLLIRDNGKGFDGNVDIAYNGNGIRNMNERAKEINGQLTVDSSKEGVSILLSFGV